MSDIAINQVLAQMRAMQALANPQATPEGGARSGQFFKLDA